VLIDAAEYRGWMVGKGDDQHRPTRDFILPSCSSLLGPNSQQLGGKGVFNKILLQFRPVLSISIPVCI